MISQLIAFILFLILILIFLIWQQIRVGIKKIKELSNIEPPQKSAMAPEDADDDPIFDTENDDYASITSLDMLNALESVKNGESTSEE